MAGGLLLLIISLSLFQDFTLTAYRFMQQDSRQPAMVVLLIIVVVGYEKKIKMVK